MIQSAASSFLRSDDAVHLKDARNDGADRHSKGAEGQSLIPADHLSETVIKRSHLRFLRCLLLLEPVEKIIPVRQDRIGRLDALDGEETSVLFVRQEARFLKGFDVGPGNSVEEIKGRSELDFDKPPTVGTFHQEQPRRGILVRRPAHQTIEVLMLHGVVEGCACSRGPIGFLSCRLAVIGQVEVIPKSAGDYRRRRPSTATRSTPAARQSRICARRRSISRCSVAS